MEKGVGVTFRQVFNRSLAGPLTEQSLYSEILHPVHPICRLLVWMGTRKAVRLAQRCDKNMCNLI